MNDIIIYDKHPVDFRIGDIVVWPCGNATSSHLKIDTTKDLLTQLQPMARTPWGPLGIVVKIERPIKRSHKSYSTIQLTMIVGFTSDTIRLIEFVVYSDLYYWIIDLSAVQVTDNL